MSDNGTKAPRYCLRRGDGYYLTANLNLATGENEIDYVASPWLARLFPAGEAQRVAGEIVDPILHVEEWRTPEPPKGRRG